MPSVSSQDYRQLAMLAAAGERESGADAGAIIYAWARQSRDYATASMAVRALYRASGARQRLRKLFDKYVDLDTASESDRRLLLCVYGDARHDATPL